MWWLSPHTLLCLLSPSLLFLFPHSLFSPCTQTQFCHLPPSRLPCKYFPADPHVESFTNALVFPVLTLCSVTHPDTLPSHVLPLDTVCNALSACCFPCVVSRISDCMSWCFCWCFTWQPQYSCTFCLEPSCLLLFS